MIDEHDNGTLKLNVIAQILNLTLMGMSPIDYDVTMMFYFDILGQIPHCIWTWWFVLYTGCKPIAYDIYIYICLLVLGVEPEAHDWWDVLCWARSSGEHG